MEGGYVKSQESRGGRSGQETPPPGGRGRAAERRIYSLLDRAGPRRYSEGWQGPWWSS